MKKLIWGGGALLALAAAAAVAVSLTLEPIVKKAVETLGPQVVGVPVHLGGFSVSPLAGRLKLKGLVVGNPPGFKTPSVLEVGEVRVRVRLRSVLSDRVVVKEVFVSGASATYEMGAGGSNVAYIQRKVDAFAGEGSAGGAAKGKPGAPEKTIRIDDFRFTGGSVRLSATRMGGKALVLPMPEVRLKKIGGEEGTAPAKAAAQVAAAVVSAIGKAAASAGRQLAPAVDSAAKAFSGIKKLFK